MAARTRSRRGWGSIRKLPSGRFQAAYTGPDLNRHTAPHTFHTRLDAEAWLARVREDVARGTWSPAGATPDLAGVTLAQYSSAWLEAREVNGEPLKPRTVAHYRSMLERFILPPLGDHKLRDVTYQQVLAWHASLKTKTGRTYRAHAYSLLRAIYRTAVAEELVDTSPCRIEGGGNVRRASKTKPLNLADLAALVTAMPERLRAMVLVAAWCGLRFGELAELRRKDVDLKLGVIKVRRGVVRSAGEVIVGSPKSEAGTRDVAIPPHLLVVLDDHLKTHAQAGTNGLLFPAANGGHLATSTLYRPFYAAREAIGRPDLRFHDLRHTAAVLAASTGATLAELMARLGHSTSAAAMRYQHAAQGRDAEIAAALSGLAKG